MPNKFRPDKNTCEVLIIGGGLSGLTLAASLGAAGVDTICLEQEPPDKTRAAAFDGRTTAIAFGPQQVLQACGVWPKLAREACPIRHIRVADNSQPPGLDFRCEEAKVSAFGWIVENRKLRAALNQRCAELKQHVRLLAPAVMQDITVTASEAKVTLTDGRIFKTQLVVGADGRRSRCRELMGIPVYGWDYDQTALVCTVTHSLPHENSAIENFLPSGPLATLPMTSHKNRGVRRQSAPNRSSIVWSVSKPTASWLATLDDLAFTAMLEEKVGAWLGSIALEGQRFSYPLNLRHAHRYTAPRFALISEAAHGIHPIAGQGLNLGMRDIAALNTEINRATELGLDLGHTDLLQNYERARKGDNGTMVLGMDLLVRLFSNAIPPLQAARRGGLGLVQHLPQLRQFFMKTAMGAAPSQRMTH